MTRKRNDKPTDVPVTNSGSPLVPELLDADQPIRPENGSDTAVIIPRNSKGQFTKGCPAGPGRPPKPPEQVNLDLFHEYMDEPRLRALFISTLNAALNGDSRARELLYKYLLPEPKVTQDVRMLSLSAHAEITPIDHESIREPWNTDEGARVLAESFGELERLGLIQATELGTTLPRRSEDDDADSGELVSSDLLEDKRFESNGKHPEENT